MINKDEFKSETKKFIDLYRELEHLIRIECEKAEIEVNDTTKFYIMIKLLIEKNHVIKYYAKDLSLICRIRNICIHNKDIDYDYSACPSPNIINKLQNILNIIKKPPLISESTIMIKWQDMYKRNINDNIYSTITTMSKKLYTHVPIFENDNLVGVFSENTLLDIVRLNTGIILDEKTDFSTIKEALKIENHSMESFEFISKSKNIYDVEDIFKKYFSTHKRIGCVFITDKDKNKEKIIGMLTAWDVLGN